MSQENLFLLHALELGAYISFVYDILRIYRRLFPHGLFWISLEDFLFWVYCSIDVFLLMHREGNGNLRWFAVLGAMLGMGVYLKLISPLFVKYTVKLLKPLVNTLRNWRRRVLHCMGNFVKKQLTAMLQAIKMYLYRQKKRRETERTEKAKGGAAHGNRKKDSRKSQSGKNLSGERRVRKTRMGGGTCETQEEAKGGVQDSP